MENQVCMRRRTLVIGLVLSAFIAFPGRAQEDSYQQEAERLAIHLHWQEGAVVAEIGAGNGELTLAAAKRVGATGRVYTTELEPKKLAHLQKLAAKEKNITALEAAVAQTNLPPECCDSMFMRLVYHHLSQPADIDKSLFQSLKPGGLLAVIDEDPQPGTKPAEGVPANRGGHGMPEKLLIEELNAVGFQVVKSIDDWPGRDATHQTYCVVFRKPGS